MTGHAKQTLRMQYSEEGVENETFRLLENETFRLLKNLMALQGQGFRKIALPGFKKMALSAVDRRTPDFLVFLGLKA